MMSGFAVECISTPYGGIRRIPLNMCAQASARALNILTRRGNQVENCTVVIEISPNTQFSRNHIFTAIARSRSH